MATAVSPEVVRELLGYDPKTGALTWKRRNRKWFGDDRAFKTWNKRFAGKPAFTSNDGSGYRVGAIFGQKLYAHRVAWVCEHGDWPNEQIDHINGDRGDNRMVNLREATHQENARNISLRSDNSSGFVGVYRDKRRNDWYAQIKVEGSTLNLGRFKNKESAVAARKAADKRYGYHPNHGRAA